MIVAFMLATVESSCTQAGREQGAVVFGRIHVVAKRRDLEVGDRDLVCGMFQTAIVINQTQQPDGLD